MLRLLFVVALMLFGAAQSFRGPFYALLFYLGFAYFRPETWIWGSQLQALNLSFIIGLWVVGYTLVSKRDRIEISTPVLLILAFLLHGLISTALSDYFEWSFPWWRGFAKVSVVTVLIISLVNTQERFRTTLVVISLSLGFEGVKQGWFHLLLNPNERNLNPIEILGDNNGVAVGMLMLSAVILSLFQTTSKTTGKGLFGFMLVGSVFRALSTFSRGGLLAFAAMTTVYWSRSKHKIRTGILIGGMATLLLSALPSSYWNRMDTIAADKDQRDFSTAGRLFFWGIAVQMANEHPLLGIGHTNFQVAYNKYDPTNGMWGRGRAVHSTWFGVLAEQGYVGLIMLVTIIFIALRACGRVRKRARRAPNGEQVFAYANGMQAALIAGVVGGTFLSYHYVEVLWHFIGLAIALERVAAHELAKEVVVTPAAAPLQPVFALTAPSGLARTATVDRRS